MHKTPGSTSVGLLITAPEMFGEGFCFSFVEKNDEGYVIEVTKPSCMLIVTVVKNEVEFKVQVHTVGCAVCPLGEYTKSTTDCTCEAIQTVPAQGTLYQAHDYGANSEDTIELKSGDMVTFRQWAVNDKLPWTAVTQPMSTCM